MVLDDFFPKQLDTASHIRKNCTYGEGLAEFGLQEGDLSNPRNGILMCEEIEHCSIALFSPITSPLVIPEYSHLKFCDIDGYSLKHPLNNLPFRRILDFHAKRSYQKAINCGWLVANSTFDAFFNMSIGDSIYMCIRQF
jgi:hypothetical protein